MTEQLVDLSPAGFEAFKAPWFGPGEAWGSRVLQVRKGWPPPFSFHAREVDPTTNRARDNRYVAKWLRISLTEQQLAYVHHTMHPDEAARQYRLRYLTS